MACCTAKIRKNTLTGKLVTFAGGIKRRNGAMAQRRKGVKAQRQKKK
jgi:hypothetical protein